MHRIDTSGAVAGLFQEGNPAIGQQATRLGAAWLNDMQENVAKVIEDAGIDLEKGNYDQLRDAIVAMIAGVVGDGDGAVPTTLTVTGAGLATGGGDLTTNRVITVPKASAAEVAAGTDDTKAVTPLALAGGIGGKSLAASGYITLLGGVIMQWVTASVSANGSTNVTLPTTFPSQCVFATFSGGAALTNAQDNDPFVSNRSASTVTVFSARDEGTIGVVFAIGF
ncbi:hypothetical protein C7451_10148 [Blastomonas natatoria]|uniref:Putative tail fiber protein gp53-like C-terminal domain-containing protein n=1 Tax=Blastomonas natatoria TaxID=34015 RepID=A0A2V3VAZ6_9SPHN|nr:hypothetical protein [Blastomonas natatoria]PXW78986.1 hypothetical protein C7451_10148 [Blastomonas natatoria]